MSKIKVVVVEPLTEPYEKVIDSSLKAMQQVVEGSIEVIDIEGYDIVLNEEGKLIGGLINRHIGSDVIVGTFFVCNHDNAGNFTSLTEEDVNKVIKMFSTTNTKYPAMIGYFKL